MLPNFFRNLLFIAVAFNTSLAATQDDFDDIDIIPEDEYFDTSVQNNYRQPVAPSSRSVSQPMPDEEEDEDLIIKEIVVVGNRNVPTEAILYAIPYAVGQIFTPIRTGQLIRNLYNLEYFKDIKLWGKRLSKSSLRLIIQVEEDPLVNSITYVGNKHLKPDEIESKLAISDMRAANLQRLEEYARQIKKLYAEKNYHDAQVVPSITITPQGNADVVFDIHEGSTALVKRVFFVGNKSVSSKKLRSMIFTREDWILGAMDKSGTYQPEAIEMDKHTLENFYQSNGFLTARVVEARVDQQPGTSNLSVTFVIEEGDCFLVSEIHINGNDMISENELIRRVGIFPGQIYSKEAIRNAMESLRIIWGEFGYVNAEIMPRIEPNFENNTVAISFDTHLGEKVFLNNIWIVGNSKTRDHVIRRQFTLHEGDILTTRDLERSKLKVEGLGYFDPRDGVNWRVKNIDTDVADLELWVKEIKTGKFYATLGFGGSLKDLTQPGDALKFEVTAQDSNILGTGMSGYLSGSAASDQQSFTANLTEPWLFGRPILAAFDAYYKRSRYDEIRTLLATPQEVLAGGSFMLGVTSYRMYDTRFIWQQGFDSLRYDTAIRVDPKVSPDPETRDLVSAILLRRFQSGEIAWISTTALQDFRSNPVHPNKGYQWSLSQKIGLPIWGTETFAFYKFEADVTYYTPLIGEYDLVFMFHSHLGLLTPLAGRNVPYRELYHIGGPATVRGFKFGEIGPQLAGDSIGGQKTFFVNTELIFPITRDLNMKGAVFYDGGAGWDTLGSAGIPVGFLRNNQFDYRHAIGVGLRMLQPTPVRVDWGFKLDKRRGEKEYEVSLTMLREF